MSGTLDFLTALRGGGSYYRHFKDDKIEVLRDQAASPARQAMGRERLVVLYADTYLLCAKLISYLYIFKRHNIFIYVHV